MTVKDITNEYLNAATPGKGKITRDDNYNESKHQNEIKTAEWLLNTFGGNIKLLNEANSFEVKTPDYLWNGSLWELKGVRSINGADKALQQAIKQIHDNPGGTIIELLNENELSIPDLDKQLLGRFLRSKINDLDVMILHNKSLLKIIKYIK